MGDPKVQRSDAGFFTRLGRAVDAFGGDAPKAKSGPSQAQVDAVQPLPKKYKATPRRLDRSVVSAPVSDSAAYKIRENETYVANALKLADDMRALAVTKDAWHNRTTPKDVDKAANKYKPLLLAASGATPVERSQARRQLAEMMIKEIYDTPTADNLFWEFESNPVYQCSTSHVASKEFSTFGSCVRPDKDGGDVVRYTATTSCSAGTETTCAVADKIESKSTAQCSERGEPADCD